MALRLLYDHNLSPKLVRRLEDIFPTSNHLFLLNLHETEDSLVWQYAKDNGFAIVSKDSDFSDRSLLFGPPPKVIRLHLGNCPTSAVEMLLRQNAEHIVSFENDPEKGCLHLPAFSWIT